MKTRSMYFISLLCVLSSFTIAFPQQIMDEMQIIDISDDTSIRRQLVRDPKAAILIVKTQIAEMRIQSNNTIQDISKPDPSTWKIKLVPGTHIISFQARGFISVKQRFYFNPKDTKGVRIIVVPAADRKEEKNTGMVVINSIPDSADVYLNEQFYGTTPYIGKLIAGRYNLKVEKEGLLPSFKEIIIRPSETLPVQIELKRTIGEISRTTDLQRKMQVAVLDFKGGTTITKEEVNTLTDRFRGGLVETGTFVVLSRKNMTSILEEIGFQISGCTSKECAVEVGKILNVQKMFIGTIGRLGQTYTITISLVDVGSTQIEKSVTRDYKGEKDQLLILIDDLAKHMSEAYIAETETKSYLWYYIGGGAAISGAVLYFLLQPEDSPSQKKLPGADGIWPPQ